MRRPSRRQFLRTAAGAAAAAPAGGASRARIEPGPFAGQGLRVFVYAGAHAETMRKGFVPACEKETGASVTLYPGWWDGVPKLKAAPKDSPPFDLMITDATQGYPAAREGLFAKLDLTNVPNHKAI